MRNWKIFPLALLILGLFVMPSKVFAGSNIEITEVELLEKSDTADIVTEASYDGLDLDLDVDFWEADDYVKYKINLHNGTENDFGVNLEKADFNHINFDFDYDDTFAAGKDMEAILTISYDGDFEDDDFTNRLVEQDGEFKLGFKAIEHELIVTPNTSGSVENELSSVPNTSDGIELKVAFAALLMIALVVFCVKNVKLSKKVVPVLAVLIALSPLTVSATEAKTLNITVRVGVRAALSWNNMKYMQEMTPEICAKVDTPDASEVDVPTRILIDTRDNKSYKVSKLADGHCWMSQSLALGGDEPIILTPEDSNVASNWTLEAAKDDDTWVSSNTDPEFYYNSKDDYDSYYYNWSAATAGSGSAVVSGEATQSICSKGWRLPKGGPTGEFADLVTAYNIAGNGEGSVRLRSAPFNFQLSGLYYGDSNIGNKGTHGYYWSSTLNSNNKNNAYNFYIFTTYVNATSNHLLRLDGFNVRCLAE